ncbi:hypothetical protein F4821DRAFT_226523 [Hypoxylon rubiginosum]|uniref:Uncharacterized protein n=1 Tax=Hypoxylon rubiginosum TaxID=110542 RepID=A0ACC0DFJ5_9PEZI|nr:hypothetical protein F4821DRAFT_226523 [Hypoxylon rubiginosum]
MALGLLHKFLLPGLRARAAASLAGAVRPSFPSSLSLGGYAGGLHWWQVALSAAVVL